MPARGVVGIGCGVIFLWLGSATAHLWTKLTHAQNIDKLGQWGDSFGALNALFAAFGFIAVVWTLGLQRQQNKEAADDQHRQRFESSFFELLKLLREARAEVSFRRSTDYYAENKGKRTLEKGIPAFRGAWLEAYFWIGKESSTLTQEGTAQIYETRVHNRFEGNLAPYFRLLHTIMSRIKKDDILTDDEKVAYGNLLRSQLNSYEVALAAINGLSPLSANFSDLLTHFRMLKYLPPGARRLVMERYYPAEAFEGRD